MRFYAETPQPLRSVLSCAGWVSTALLCVLAASVAAAEQVRPSPPGQAPAAGAHRWTLNAPPVAGDFSARLAWARKEADALRAMAAKTPRNPHAGTLLAALSVVVASDLEHAISVGDIDSATGLRELFEKKLGDAPVRLALAARHGAGGGQFALGVLALHGILEARDRERACRLFESAWAARFRLAAYRLSDCVAVTNPVRAEALLRFAADAGHAAATEDLGRRCLDAAPQDLACALGRIGSAARAGRASAKSLLGWMYAQGAGTPADPARALALYLEAAKAGDLSARNNLGELHETGRGVPADAGKAFKHYREAAEAGFAPGQFNLGRLYAAGVGTPRDYAKARIWLRSALEAGVQPARRILDWMDTQPAEPAQR